MNLVRATLRSDNTVFPQLDARPRARAGHQTAADDGHHEPARRLPGRGPRRPDRRRLAAGDGARVRDDHHRRLPLQRHGDPKVDVPRRPRRAPRPAREEAGLHRRRDLRGDEDPRGERPARHRPERPAIGCPAAGKTGTTTTTSTPGSSASRPADHGRLGRLRRSRASPMHGHHRRHDPRADLARLHEGRARAATAASSRRRPTPFVGRPFFGKYAGGRGPSAATSTSTSTDPTATTPGGGAGRERPGHRRDVARHQDAGHRRPAPAAEAARTGKYPPDQYESPPQGAPGGGAKAPG